ncbi:MAG TPA: mechanosensitive ion channel domain-containing protein [Terrimicrobiaceae bacterium]
MMRRTLSLIFILALAYGEIRAQSLQKLLEGAKDAVSGQKSQPSAAEQKAWASEKVSEFQAKEKELNEAELREKLQKANLPETRSDEFLSALRDIIRNYQAAVDTLAAVVNKESRSNKPAPSESIPLPKDDAEADASRDKLAGLRAEAQTAETQVHLDEEFLARQQSALKAAGQELRRFQEEFDTANTDVARDRAALQLRLAEIQQQAASSAAFLGAWRLYADELDLRTSQAGIRAYEHALSASGLDSVFNEKRARAAIDRIEKEKASVQKQIESAQSARQSLDETVSRLEEGRQAATGENGGKAVDARLEIAREARELAARIATAGQSWTDGLDEVLRMWKTTLSVAENPSPAAYVDARKLADQLLTQADPWRQQIGRYLQDARERLDELESQPRSRDAATSKLEEQRLDLARERVTQVRSISTLFENLLSHAEQMRAESSQLLKQSSVSERVTQGFAELGNKTESFWNHELFTTEEKIIGEDGSLVTRMRGISVGKIVLGIIGLAAGLFVAKTLAGIVRNNLGRRFAVDTARAAFLEKVLYYILLALVVLTTLNWLRIPLTAFAFLGGAIAIGVGFGAQTLMNNFISGLILLAEQRIKVGDLIDVDGHLGRVINLGTRCSRVRKFDGVDVLVPNSYLLEKNVINWTLSDPHHRFDFVLGVSYGASTELVLSTLHSAIEAQPEVLREPKASVIFEAFGDNALTFHLYYWLDIGRFDANKVGSEIRVRIDRLCREAGIEIAYPQRDIHLHTSQPILVRLEDGEHKIQGNDH